MGSEVVNRKESQSGESVAVVNCLTLREQDLVLRIRIKSERIRCWALRTGLCPVEEHLGWICCTNCYVLFNSGVFLDRATFKLDWDLPCENSETKPIKGREERSYGLMWMAWGRD